MSKLLETCPICGSELEVGYAFNTMTTDLGFWGKKKSYWSRDLRLKGGLAPRCPHCEIIFLPYGERAEEIEREESLKKKEHKNSEKPREV